MADPQPQKRGPKAGDTMDAWKTDGNEYDPSRFYTGSKDRQGHSTVIHVKIPDHFVGRLNEMRDLVKEYRSHADMVRDALIHRVYWLEENLEGLEPSDLTKAIMLHESLDRRRREIQSMTDLVKSAEDVFSSLKALNDVNGIVEEMEMHRNIAFTVREPYRTRLLDVLEKYDPLPEIRKRKKANGKKVQPEIDPEAEA